MQREGLQAMILAAGFGTRLKPLTDSLPKALVPVCKKPALYWHLRRLQKMGVTHFAINAHSLAPQIQTFVQHDPARQDITLFVEQEILGTGGGLLNTQNFWQEQSFFLCNADIFCTANLLAAYHEHQRANNLVTLLTQDRPTQTKWLVDEQNNICGIHYHKTQDYRLLRPPTGALKEQGFSGIHVIHPDIFSLMTESGNFSIIDCYLRLIQNQHPIRAFDIQAAYWKDIGTLEKLQALEADWQTHPHLRLCYESETPPNA